MKDMYQFRTASPYSTIAALIKLLDVLVILLTLASIIAWQNQAWSEQYTWWLFLVITLQSLGEFNPNFSEQSLKFSAAHATQLIVYWTGSVLVIFLMNQFVSLISVKSQPLFWAWVIITPILILLCRHITNNLLKFILNKPNRIAIVGANDLSYALQKKLTATNLHNVDFIGFFDKNPSEQTSLSGNLQQLVSETQKGHIEHIYITLPLCAESQIEQLTKQLADTTASVYLIPNLFNLNLLRPHAYCINGLPVLSIYDTPFAGIEKFIKRAFDIIVGGFILGLILLPLIVIALAIKFSSDGPILFKQRRYGLDGKEVIVWKFRSMTVCEDGHTVNQATKNDPRVTKLGSFLRRTSLDELPQFINVLQGQMSIVGPRPHAVVHNEFYRTQIKGYMLRHKVKPGITGLAQISGYRGETNTLDKMEGRIHYDLMYIQNWSLYLDIKIVLLTIYKGFMSAGAY